MNTQVSFVLRTVKSDIHLFIKCDISCGYFLQMLELPREINGGKI